MKIGLQTFTVKKAIATPEGLDKTMAEIAAAGIKHLEIAVDYLKYPLDASRAKEIKPVLDKYGIEAVSAQVRQWKVEGDPAGYFKAFDTLGIKYITNSVIDVKCLKDGAKGVAAYAQKLEKYNAMLAENGFELGHHNHHFECLRYDNKTIFDIMAENYGGKFVLDTYWMARGGIDPIGLIKKLGGRVRIMHIRDFKIKLSLLGLSPCDAAVGCGNINFPALLPDASALGVEYGMIEQSTKEELANAKISAANALAVFGVKA